MKKCNLKTRNSLSVFFLFLIIPFFLTSCDDKQYETITWTEYEPVYMTQEEFYNAVETIEPRELENPGKIYFYDGYLFVNEVNKGVHIIDNTDPSSPHNVGFITIPANKDIAVSDNLLYADSYGDLLVFNIEDLNNPELIHRTEDAFDHIEFTIPRGHPYRQVSPELGILVDWEEVIVEEVCENGCSHHAMNGGGFGFAGDDWVTVSAESSGGGRSGGSGGATGVGGSMARFAISGEYLYAVDHRQMITFHISSPQPDVTNKQNIGWAIETIFPYEDNLFIGSASAMYIYSISSPAAPELLSQYNHFTACDPVVVEGEYAYVTLRSGNMCQWGVNRLEVIHIKDLLNPKLTATYDMINPHGLGIDNGTLFISEGEHGLKIMDANDPKNIKELRHIKSIKTYDVIPLDNVLMVTGASGIVQYDYTDIDDIKELSTIPVINKK